MDKSLLSYPPLKGITVESITDKDRSPTESQGPFDSGQTLKPISGWMVALLATACGLTVANLYYAQPLINIIALSLDLTTSAASLIVTLTQLGYCAGLIFLVPLGDLLENRRLVVCTLVAIVVASTAAAIAPSSMLFLTAMVVLGVSAVAAQMLVPIAAHMAPESSRGQVVGSVMSGLLLGVLLSRPVSILIADHFGWRCVFAVSAALMATLALMMWKLLPSRHPSAQQKYTKLIGSLWMLWHTNPVLRRRAIYQAGLFASFTLFWTTVPLQLAGPTINLSQSGIALFALAGALGVIAAPIAGRIADRGWGRAGTGISLAMVASGFLVAMWGTESVIALVIASVLLDIGVQVNLVIGQREIYALNADQRSRLNGLYVAFFFVGGSIGSAMASPLFTHGGWTWVTWVGLAIPVLTLALYVSE